MGAEGKKYLAKTFALLMVLTIVLIWYTFLRQAQREERKKDAVGTYWAVAHMLFLLFTIAPMCSVVLKTLDLSFFGGNWIGFCMGVWALVMVLIVYNMVFEFAEEKIGKGNRSFADSIDKASKIESHLMNFLAVAGFYSSVVGEEVCEDVKSNLDYLLLFAAFVVFLDLLVLNIYEQVYLIRGKDEPESAPAKCPCAEHHENFVMVRAIGAEKCSATNGENRMQEADSTEESRIFFVTVTEKQ